MLFKKLAVGGMAALLVALSVMPASAAGIEPQGQAVVLLDGGSGQVLYQQNGQVRHFPASTTKLLTALVAVEHGKLDQVIQASSYAVQQGVDTSTCYLETGEKQTLENLLLGLLLVSGNDCAQAIAEGVGNGQSAQFITWMNETAARLGATNSHFANPHGLHDPNHYTTAQDLALIARAALTNPTVRRISGTPDFFWPGKSERNGLYHNHNQLLYAYDGVIGGKTGWTEEARHTLVNAAERGGRLFIGVVMDEPNQPQEYGDMTTLLDMGFSSFEKKTAVAAGTSFGDVTVAGGKVKSVTAVAQKDFPVSAPKSGQQTVTVTPKLEPSATAPVTPGQKLGVVEIREGNRLLGTVPLVAETAVAERAFFTLASAGTKQTVLAGAWTGVQWLVYAVAGLFCVRIVVKGTRRIIRRGRRRRPGASAAGDRSQGVISYYRSKGP